jgi:3-dehydroquinate synthetase
VARIEKLFANAGLPVRIKLKAPHRKKLFTAMQLDKKVSGGEVKFVLATKIGRVKYGCKVPTGLIEQILES